MAARLEEPERSESLREGVLGGEAMMSLTLRCTRAPRFRPSRAGKVLQKVIWTRVGKFRRLPMLEDIAREMCRRCGYVVESRSAKKRLQGRYNTISDLSASMRRAYLDVF